MIDVWLVLIDTDTQNRYPENQLPRWSTPFAHNTDGAGM